MPYLFFQKTAHGAKGYYLIGEIYAGSFVLLRSGAQVIEDSWEVHFHVPLVYAGSDQ